MAIRVNNRAVKKMRLQRSWSQEKLADAAGINLRTIQRVEKDGIASLHTCTAIAEALAVEPVSLLIDDDLVHRAKSNPQINSRILIALLVNAVVFICWGISLIVVSILDLPAKQAGIISFCFLFFAGIILLAFLTSIARWRYWVIAASIVISMLLSPPNVLAQLPLALLMWVIFEVSVLLAKHFNDRSRGDNNSISRVIGESS